MTTLAELTYDIEADEQTIENLGVLFFGTVTQSGYNQAAITAPAGTATISAPTPRNIYDLGKFGLTTVVVTQFGALHLTWRMSSFSVDYERGTIYIIDGGAIVHGTAVSVTFGCAALVMDTIQALTTLNRSGRFVLYESGSGVVHGIQECLGRSVVPYFDGVPRRRMRISAGSHSPSHSRTSRPSSVGNGSRRSQLGNLKQNCGRRHKGGRRPRGQWRRA